jgi:GH25 family lysozyme M1 (1,4-beta-N-acetylmuramidase)
VCIELQCVSTKQQKRKANLEMIAALAFLSSLSVAMATGGVDVSQRTYVDNWSCMVKNGKSFAIVRVYQSNGKPDANGRYPRRP